MESVFQREFWNATGLSNVDPSIARLMVVSGDTDDIVRVGRYKGPASKLRPSQTSMVLENSLGSAVRMILKGKIGGNLGAMISRDYYILDGHHRWSAAILAGGSSAQVSGFMADMPGKLLIRLLNIVSKGAFDFHHGNPGGGSILEYTPENIERALKIAVEQGIQGKKSASALDVQNALTLQFGSVKRGISGMAENSRYMEKSTPSWAPNRSEMPVIPKDRVDEAAQLLKGGDVDWHAPYRMARRIAAAIEARGEYPGARRDR